MNEIYSVVGQQIIAWWIGVGIFYYFYAKPRGQKVSLSLNIGVTIGVMYCVFILAYRGFLP